MKDRIKNGDKTDYFLLLVIFILTNSLFMFCWFGALTVQNEAKG